MSRRIRLDSLVENRVAFVINMRMVSRRSRLYETSRANDNSLLEIVSISIFSRAMHTCPLINSQATIE
jgi:hypothetical protein